MNCPKCGSKTRKASSIEAPWNERYRRCVCKNEECAYVFYTGQRIIMEPERIVDISECKELFQNHRRGYYQQHVINTLSKKGETK